MSADLSPTTYPFEVHLLRVRPENKSLLVLRLAALPAVGEIVHVRQPSADGTSLQSNHWRVLHVVHLGLVVLDATGQPPGSEVVHAELYCEYVSEDEMMSFYK
jgi:hypothetical protein